MSVTRLGEYGFHFRSTHPTGLRYRDQEVVPTEIKNRKSKIKNWIWFRLGSTHLPFPGVRQGFGQNDGTTESAAETRKDDKKRTVVPIIEQSNHGDFLSPLLTTSNFSIEFQQVLHPLPVFLPVVQHLQKPYAVFTGCRSIKHLKEKA
jgi:hypothetical protein